MFVDLVLSPFLSLFFPLCFIHCLLLIISSVFLHQSSVHLIMFVFLYSSFIIFHLSTYFTFKYFIIPHIRFHSLSLFRLFLFTSNLFVLLFFMIVTTNTYCFIIWSTSIHHCSFTSSYNSSFLSSSFVSNMRKHQQCWLCLHYFSFVLDDLLWFLNPLLMTITVNTIKHFIMYMLYTCISSTISWIIEKRNLLYKKSKRVNTLTVPLWEKGSGGKGLRKRLELKDKENHGVAGSEEVLIFGFLYDFSTVFIIILVIPFLFVKRVIGITRTRLLLRRSSNTFCIFNIFLLLLIEVI